MSNPNYQHPDDLNLPRPLVILLGAVMFAGIVMLLIAASVLFGG